MSIQAPSGATRKSGAYEFVSDPLEAAVDAPGPLGGAGKSRPRLPHPGELALLAVVACGALIAFGASGTAALLPETTRPIPSWLAGPFGVSGAQLGTGGLIAVLSAMFVSYLVAVRHATRVNPRVVLLAIGALNALMLLAPPLLSTDIFSYQAYARMGALYAVNPYLSGPHVIALDPIYPLVGAKWVATPSAYGPLFTLLSYGLAQLSIAASVLSYKALAALSSLALVALVWRAAARRGLDPVRCAAFVGLNPMLVLYGVGGGHNDLAMLALAVGGIYLLLAQRDLSAGASMGLAAAIKLTGGVFAAFAAAETLRPALAPRRRRRDLLAGVAASAAVVGGVSLAVFGVGSLNMFVTVLAGQSKGDWHTLSGFISTRIGLPGAGHAVGLVLAGAFVLLTVWLLAQVWRGAMDWLAGAGWATLALLITASALFPWYVAWLIPLAALASSRRLWQSALVLTGAVQVIQMLGYIPH